MSATTTSLIVLLCVFGAALFGMLLRYMLPEHHFSSETKDTVKLAMGFIATMSALILGLLVAGAKDSYDKQASGVTQMAAKVVYLDRMLANFGPETKDVRALYRRGVEQVVKRMWPENNSGESQLDPSTSHTEALFAAIGYLFETTGLHRVYAYTAVENLQSIAMLKKVGFRTEGTLRRHATRDTDRWGDTMLMAVLKGELADPAK